MADKHPGSVFLAMALVLTSSLQGPGWASSFHLERCCPRDRDTRVQQSAYWLLKPVLGSDTCYFCSHLIGWNNHMAKLDFNSKSLPLRPAGWTKLWDGSCAHFK